MFKSGLYRERVLGSTIQHIFCCTMSGTRRLWQNSHIFTLSCPQAFSGQSLPQLVMPAESSAENPAKRADRLYQASGHSDVQAYGNNKATLIGIEPNFLGSAQENSTQTVLGTDQRNLSLRNGLNSPDCYFCKSLVMYKPALETLSRKKNLKNCRRD